MKQAVNVLNKKTTKSLAPRIGCILVSILVKFILFIINLQFTIIQSISGEFVLLIKM